jgi:hypothetical protein
MQSISAAMPAFTVLSLPAAAPRLTPSISIRTIWSRRAGRRSSSILAQRITFKQMQVYDLARAEESYDLVWFMGVFYHLRYPFLALNIVAQKVRRLMIFQTAWTPSTT